MLGSAEWRVAPVIELLTGGNCECGCSSLHYVGLLIHDLRRTGCRNLRRLGVHEKTIMKIGDWKTRSVFDRYNIVDEKDLAEAAAKLDQNAQRRKLRHSSWHSALEIQHEGREQQRELV